MKKIKVIVFLFIATIGVVFVSNIVVLVSNFLDGHRQKACLRDVERFLISSGDFFEDIDDQSFITDNPQIVEEAMRDVLNEHPHFERYLFGTQTVNE